MTLDKIESRWTLPVGLAVSPDGNSVLYVRLVDAADDLMLIENFH
jgi:hypothetical protein